MVTEYSVRGPIDFIFFFPCGDFDFIYLFFFLRESEKGRTIEG